MTKVIYYTTITTESPFVTFLDSLIPKQQKKITRVISYIESYGLTSAVPHVKKLLKKS